MNLNQLEIIQSSELKWQDFIDHVIASDNKYIEMAFNQLLKSMEASKITTKLLQSEICKIYNHVMCAVLEYSENLDLNSN